MRRALLLLALLLPLAARAAPWPRIAQIRFVGNDTTRDYVILREMTLAPLSNKPLVRDLVSEIAPPAERLFK